MDLGRDRWHTYAVEVTRDRISWFVDAHVVHTERRPEIWSGVPLVPRFTMEAKDGRTMNVSRMQMDWIRHWSLEAPNDLPVDAPPDPPGHLREGLLSAVAARDYAASGEQEGASGGHRRDLRRAARDRAGHLVGRRAHVEGPARATKGRGFVLYRHAAPHGRRPARRGRCTTTWSSSSPRPRPTRWRWSRTTSTPFFTIDHFRGFNAVLVQQSRLGEISRDELVEVITDAWAHRAPKRLVREHLDG